MSHSLLSVWLGDEINSECFLKYWLQDTNSNIIFGDLWCRKETIGHGTVHLPEWLELLSSPSWGHLPSLRLDVNLCLPDCWTSHIPSGFGILPNPTLHEQANPCRIAVHSDSDLTPFCSSCPVCLIQRTPNPSHLAGGKVNTGHSQGWGGARKSACCENSGSLWQAAAVIWGISSHR